MADGTLKVGTIITSSGSGTITLGQSGETVTIPSGATINLSNATQTGVGGANTPNWLAVPSGNQSISDTTNTQISFQNEVFDSDSAFASNAFTVPSGKGGKYMLQAQMRINSMSDGKETQMAFRKNGASDFGESGNNYAVMMESTGAAHNSYYSHTMITNLSAGDVISVWIYHNNGNSRDLNATYTRFSGYRLIE